MLNSIKLFLMNCSRSFRCRAKQAVVLWMDLQRLVAQYVPQGPGDFNDLVPLAGSAHSVLSVGQLLADADPSDQGHLRSHLKTGRFGRSSVESFWSVVAHFYSSARICDLRPAGLPYFGLFPSLKLLPLLAPPGTGHCVAARRPPPRPRDDGAARMVFWPPLPASWHSCRFSPPSPLRGA